MQVYAFFMETIWEFLTGTDSFSRDYFGITVTIISNIISVAYNKFIELFKRKTGVSKFKIIDL